MVSQKDRIYYTFRVMSVATPSSTLRVDVSKWEEGDDLPSETYKVNPDNPSHIGGCGCPAWKRDCKHMKCVEYLRDSGLLNEAHTWRWNEKRGWEKMNDMKEDW